VSHFTFYAARIGVTGSGTKLKLAANHHVAILNVACAEMVAFCRKMGLDPRVALRHMGNSPYIGTGLMRIGRVFNSSQAKARRCTRWLDQVA